MMMMVVVVVVEVIMVIMIIAVMTILKTRTFIIIITLNGYQVMIIRAMTVIMKAEIIYDYYNY